MLEFIQRVMIAQKFSNFNPELPADDDLSAGKVFIEDATIFKRDFTA